MSGCAICFYFQYILRHMFTWIGDPVSLNLSVYWGLLLYYRKPSGPMPIFCQLDSPRPFPILILKYKHFVEENSLQNVVYNMSAILSQPKCIEHSRWPHADCMDPNVQKGLLTLQLNHSALPVLTVYIFSLVTKNATNPTVCAKFIQANIMKKHQSGMIGLCLRRIHPHTKGQ